ncbi:unnamed protein product [Miscanthus lutarioriparius]|uniref:Uncharacterized protein n=1 Tax=Miscanthus lutarioriparius TaxID=422564 RepID=A0A811NJU9_9POAL|nr:unnamed protein product [Miscanthus lutarioriparius]
MVTSSYALAPSPCYACLGSHTVAEASAAGAAVSSRQRHSESRRWRKPARRTCKRRRAGGAKPTLWLWAADGGAKLASDHRIKRSCGPRPRLIEECDIIHYAFSCAEQVENIHEPATYTEAVVSGDREKWISAMQEEMQSLKKNDT